MLSFQGISRSGPIDPIGNFRQQMIGVRTAVIEHQALGGTVRTVGTVAFDETRVTMVNTKIAGWVDRVFVDYVGKAVRKGQPLFSVYSPELVSTQKGTASVVTSSPHS